MAPKPRRVGPAVEKCPVCAGCGEVGLQPHVYRVWVLLKKDKPTSTLEVASALGVRREAAFSALAKLAALGLAQVHSRYHRTGGIEHRQPATWLARVTPEEMRGAADLITPPKD